MSKAKRKREEKRRFWAKQILSWQESGLSQAEFCRRNKLRKFQFIYWKKKFDSQLPSVSLVPVKIRQELPGIYEAGPVNLILRDRYRVELRRNFDQIALEQLLQVLERS